ncbi:MAG: TlpA family protein disulfide reductase [Thermodesulfobacteriota bacterium]
MVKKIIFLSLWISLVGFLFCVSAQSKVEELFGKIKIQPLREVKKAPPFCLKNLEGEIIELKNFKGRVILLNFWATWCSPCKEEMPSMETLYQQFDRKDFTLLAVSVDFEESKNVKKFIEKSGYTFPVLVDPKGKILDLYGVRAIPTTFLIDQNGLILGKAIGPRRWDTPDVVSLIHLLLTGKNKI